MPKQYFFDYNLYSYLIIVYYPNTAAEMHIPCVGLTGRNGLRWYCSWTASCWVCFAPDRHTKVILAICDRPPTQGSRAWHVRVGAAGPLATLTGPWGPSHFKGPSVQCILFNEDPILGPLLSSGPRTTDRFVSTTCRLPWGTASWFGRVPL